MRATRAYIASAGTASVMLAASLAMLALVSTYVAFGSWPGANSGRSLDQVVLDAVAKPAAPRKVAVHPNAVAVAHRAAARRQVALARSGKTGHTRTHAGTRSAGGGTTPAAQAPSSSTGASTSTGSETPAASVPAAVQQPVKNVVNNVTDTTGKVGGQVQQTTGDVQNQVNDVVNQVTGAAPPPTTPPSDPVGGAVQTVTNTAGSVLGH
jgi:hypothetical protein